MHLKEAIQKIRDAGLENTRISVQPNGKAKIEIKKGNNWVTVMKDIQNMRIAEDIMRQASSRLLLG